MTPCRLRQRDWEADRMQRLRVRYTKLGRIRFLSARDLTSVWERSLRRAGLPIAYSEGFTPHAKVSFPDALPVGFASTAEYAELTFAADIEPSSGLAKLSAAMPTGMDIMTYVTVPEGARRLSGHLKATLWEIAWPGMPADQAEDLHSQLSSRGDALVASTSVEVVRHRPKGDRILDVRPPLVSLATFTTTDGDMTAPILRVVLRNDGPTIRPTDLKTALDTLSGTDGPLPQPRLYSRLAQGLVHDDGVVEALTQQVNHLHPDRLAEAA